MFREHQIIIAGAPGIDKDFYTKSIGKNRVQLIFNQTYSILSHAEVALVTSGTATLEAALLNVPQVVCYKTPVPKLAYWGFKHLLHTPYISLVNLIANKEVVKELFAKFFSVNNIQEEVDNLLYNDEYRQRMLNDYKVIQKTLGSENASDKAAKLIYEKNKHQSSTP